MTAQWTTDDLVAFVQREFNSLSDPIKAGPMAAYMKTEMPFYGIQKPERLPVYRQMKALFPPNNPRQYCAGVLALWKLPHREEKYAALEYAKQHRQFITFKSFPLYETLIREGLWWDLVDDIATCLVNTAYLLDRHHIRPVIDAWIDDPCLWIRRTAILAHHRHKKETDWKQLFEHVLRRSLEKEFFIRKAIGWALRDYSYSEPLRVMSFITKHKERLSSLSYRLACRALIRNDYMN